MQLMSKVTLIARKMIKTRPKYIPFSPDGRYVLTGSADGTARLWDADYHDTITSLCSRLLRDFSDDERAQYGIPNDAPTCPKT
jgi:WD40 repeat protein